MYRVGNLVFSAPKQNLSSFLSLNKFLSKRIIRIIVMYTVESSALMHLNSNNRKYFRLNFQVNYAFLTLNQHELYKLKYFN